jgi:hypothetical protein
MKPLILILVVAISAEAQNLADAARQERARQAQHKSTRVFSDVNAHVVKSATPAESTAASAAKPKAGTAAPGGTAATAVAAAAAAVDPLAEEMQKLRIRVRALEDQETSLKLQIVETTNQVYAPLTDQTTHNEALTRLGEVQVKLADVQKTLASTRSDLQQMEIQAAAKK